MTYIHFCNITSQLCGKLFLEEKMGQIWSRMLVKEGQDACQGGPGSREVVEEHCVIRCL